MPLALSSSLQTLLRLVEAVSRRLAHRAGAIAVRWTVGDVPVVNGSVTTVGPFQAATVAIWRRYTLVRLWAIISNRNSVRTLILPLRWKRTNPLLCLVSP